MCGDREPGEPVGGREGARDHRSARGVPRDGGGRLRHGGGPRLRRLVRDRAGRHRRAGLERARLSRGHARAARPPGGAGADRRQVRRRGPHAPHSGGAVRQPVPPARHGARQRRRGALAPPIRLRDGRPIGRFKSVDLDQLALSTVEHYRLLVPRRSPVASRPPSNYRLAWRGRWYDVWRRAGAAPVAHLSFGDRLHAAAVPSCATLRRFAARHRGRALVAAGAPEAVIAGLPAGRLPDGWSARRRFPGAALASRSGTVTTTFELPHGGRWRVWVGGAVLGRLHVFVDGKEVASLRHRLNQPAISSPSPPWTSPAAATGSRSTSTSACSRHQRPFPDGPRGTERGPSHGATESHFAVRNPLPVRNAAGLARSRPRPGIAVPRPFGRAFRGKRGDSCAMTLAPANAA